MNILDPQGPIGAAEKTILIDSLGIMLAIVLPTIVAIFAFAFWFRPPTPGQATCRIGSIRVALSSWSGRCRRSLSFARWRCLARRPPPRPPKPIEGPSEPLTIQAVSLDWKWLFIYPDHKVATINTLTVPAGVPLQFQLTSQA